MSVVFPLLLGLIQGIAEFLPISSSGHLALMQSYFGEELRAQVSVTGFSVLLHAGTLCAVLIAYRREVCAIAGAMTTLPRGFLKEKRKRWAQFDGGERAFVLVAVGTLPLVALKIADELAGRLTGAGLIDEMDLRIACRPAAVGLILIFNGALLYFSEKIGKGDRALEELTVRGALAVGLFQMLAVLPGLSRSGATFVAGRMCGLRREEALRFSFLLSVPAVLGSIIVEVPELIGSKRLGAREAVIFGGAAAIAFVAGLMSLGLLRRISRKKDLKGFAYYTAGLGVLTLIFDRI